MKGCMVLSGVMFSCNNGYIGKEGTLIKEGFARLGIVINKKHKFEKLKKISQKTFYRGKTNNGG